MLLAKNNVAQANQATTGITVQDSNPNTTIPHKPGSNINSTENHNNTANVEIENSKRKRSTENTYPLDLSSVSNKRKKTENTSASYPVNSDSLFNQPRSYLHQTVAPPIQSSLLRQSDTSPSQLRSPHQPESFFCLPGSSHQTVNFSTQPCSTLQSVTSSRDDITLWSVEEVYQFVNSIELCEEYSQVIIFA